MFQFPNRFRITRNIDISGDYSIAVVVSIPEPVQDYSEPGIYHVNRYRNHWFQFPNRFRITRNRNIQQKFLSTMIVSIPEPVQDYSEQLAH